MSQLQGEGDEPLLGAVVEVALEPPALGVARFDVRARLRSLAARRLPQSLVLERERGRGATASISSGSSSSEAS